MPVVGREHPTTAARPTAGLGRTVDPRSAARVDALLARNPVPASRKLAPPGAQCPSPKMAGDMNEANPPTPPKQRDLSAHTPMMAHH